MERPGLVSRGARLGGGGGWRASSLSYAQFENEGGHIRTHKSRSLGIALTLAAAMMCAAIVSAPVSATDAATAAWERAAPILHHHAPQTVPTCAGDTVVDGTHVVDCAGLIDSFDGQSLSVVVWLPKDATAPLPTLVYLHAFGSGRGEFSSPKSPWKPPFTAQSLAARGYAVVTPAARGMNGSCGMAPNTGPHDEDGRPQPEMPHGPGDDFTCSRGWSHLNDREFETKDVQHLLSVLVDAKVADANRLFAAGYSYGGAQTWMLATSEPWTTPKGRSGIQLAGATPIAGGTSAINTFTPNGRASDGRRPTAGRSLERPYGVPKLRLYASIAVGGHATIGLPRFNEADSSETHSYAPGWFAFWSKGEPFDTPEGAKFAAMLRDRKSSYPPGRYIAALDRGVARPVPILAVQGWNDTLFTPVETLLMYRALKAAAPDYPVSMIFADIGHPTGRGMGTKAVQAEWNNRVIDFLDTHAFVASTGATGGGVLSLSTECSPVLGGDVPMSRRKTAADWDAIHPDALTLRSPPSARLVTRSDGVDPSEEPRTDPNNFLSEDGEAGCITQLPGTYDSNDLISWPVPLGGLELLGLPTLSADYELTGEDATVVARLWDQAPDGTRTLVSRGVYRLALTGGSQATGTVKAKLFGNHYRMAKGHTIQLELTQTDIPFLQPDRFKSTVSYSNIRLHLPTAVK